MQETQVEPGVEGQAVDEVIATPDLTKEIERKEAEIKRLQGLLKDSQRRGIPKEELDILQKRLDGVEESHAEMFDYIVEHLGEGETEKPVRKTRRQQLEESRKAKITPAPELAPDVKKFIGYLDSQDLAYDDPIVEEATADNRTPQEALKYLKEKMDTKSQAMIEEKARILVEQKLKEKGLTTSGIDAPSAPGGKVFTQKGIEEMSIEEYTANKEAIASAYRAGKIK